MHVERQEVWTAPSAIGTVIMQITVKTLANAIVSVDIAADSTVGQLKEALSAQQAEWRRIRLVCNGAELRDDSMLDQSVAPYLDGGSDRFIVAVVNSREQKAPPTIPADTSPTPAPDTVAPPAPSAMAEPVASSTAAEPAADEGLQALLHMGFDRPAAESALLTSGGDVARAVDALTGGGAGGAAVAQSGRAARAGALARGLMADETQLAMLRRMPEVQRLLRMPRLAGIEDRPAELERLLQRILLRPELQQAMKEGRVTDQMIDSALAPDAPPTRAERFLALAQQRAMALDRAAAPAGGSSGAGGAGALEQQLGAEGEAAVARLMELGGFSRGQAIEAYLACERDEALAASLLFDQMH